MMNKVKLEHLSNFDIAKLKGFHFVEQEETKF